MPFNIIDVNEEVTRIRQEDFSIYNPALLRLREYIATRTKCEFYLIRFEFPNVSLDLVVVEPEDAKPLEAYDRLLRLPLYLHYCLDSIQVIDKKSLKTVAIIKDKEGNFCVGKYPWSPSQMNELRETMTGTTPPRKTQWEHLLES